MGTVFLPTPLTKLAVLHASGDSPVPISHLAWAGITDVHYSTVCGSYKLRSSAWVVLALPFEPFQALPYFVQRQLLTLAWKSLRGLG